MNVGSSKENITFDDKAFDELQGHRQRRDRAQHLARAQARLLAVERCDAVPLRYPSRVASSAR
ncbi:MAG: hypothetical protein WKF40_07055 [Thermoleophilaceae bacterium]